MNFSEAKTYIAEIMRLTEVEVSIDSPEECLSCLEALSARLGMIAGIWKVFEEKSLNEQAIALKGLQDQKLGSQERRDMVKGICAEYISLMNMAENVESALRHRISSLQSIIKYRIAEMQNLPS